MRELDELELGMPMGGISDFDIFSLSVMGGTLIGAGLGAYGALNYSVLNISQLVLLPVWVAAGSGVGAFAGMTLGAMMGMGGIGMHHLGSGDTKY